MLALLFVTILSSFVLGSQDYQLEVLNPKVPVKQEANKTNQYSHVKLTLALSSDIIDFGLLRPTVPVLRETILTASTTDNYKYSIFAYEDHPLKSSDNFIHDTTCDNGICSETINSDWTNPLVFGFGINVNEKTFQQLAHQEAGEAKQAILKAKNSQQSKIIYKLNVPNTQTSGIYTNTITYILVPDY